MFCFFSSHLSSGSLGPLGCQRGPDTVVPRLGDGAEKRPSTKCSRSDDGQTATGCAPLCAAAALLTLMNGECAPPCHAHGCHGQPDGKPGEDGGKAGDGTDENDGNGRPC